MWFWPLTILFPGKTGSRLTVRWLLGFSEFVGLRRAFDEVLGLRCLLPLVDLVSIVAMVAEVWLKVVVGFRVGRLRLHFVGVLFVFFKVVAVGSGGGG